MVSNYHYGLLCLCHLIISADGVVSDKELNALKVIKEKENVPDELFNEFQESVKEKLERDIYRDGIAILDKCTKEEKLDIFSILYKLSEADNHIHVKEIRLLLYSLKDTGISFDDIVAHTMKSSYHFNY